MITEAMLCKAAARSCEIYVAYLEKGYDPQNKHVFLPEFEKNIRDLKNEKRPGRLNVPHHFIKKMIMSPVRTKTAITGAYCRFGICSL